LDGIRAGRAAQQQGQGGHFIGSPTETNNPNRTTAAAYRHAIWQYLGFPVGNNQIIKASSTLKQPTLLPLKSDQMSPAHVGTSRANRLKVDATWMGLSSLLKA
jgi:hypothetical protein